MKYGSRSLKQKYRLQFYGKKADKNQAVFSAKTKKKEESVPSDPLGYYRKLCEQFPNISFRLVDEETGAQNTDKICLGYNGSMNQIGENFSGVGHCSINLDISVIRKMQEDPEYEQGMISLIKRTEKMYPSIENDTRALGISGKEIYMEYPMSVYLINPCPNAMPPDSKTRRMRDSKSSSAKGFKT